MFLCRQFDFNGEKGSWIGRAELGRGGVRKILPCKSCSQSLMHFPVKYLFLTINRFRLECYVDPCPVPVSSSSSL